MKASHKTGLIIILISTIILSLTFSQFSLKTVSHFPYSKETDENSLKLLVKSTNASSWSLEKQYNKQSKYGLHDSEIKQLKCRVLPDILIIGFEKCGTGTLRRFMSIHPKVWLVEGSGMDTFFSPDNNKSLQEFAKGKPCIPKGKLLLEKLAVNGLPEKVYEYTPHVNLIAIVREPTERVLSVYLHRVHTGRIPAGIKDFEAFTERMRSGRYKNQSNSNRMTTLNSQRNGNVVSIYFNRLKPWVDVFGVKNILILDGDEFAVNPVKELSKAESFIGLEHKLNNWKFYFNKKKGFYCTKPSSADDGCMQKGKGRPHPVMQNSTRKALKDFFKPHNQRFYELIGRSFPWDS